MVLLLLLLVAIRGLIIELDGCCCFNGCFDCFCCSLILDVERDRLMVLLLLLSIMLLPFVLLPLLPSTLLSPPPTKLNLFLDKDENNDVDDCDNESDFFYGDFIDSDDNGVFLSMFIILLDWCWC